MTAEPYKGYDAACAYWAKVRADPDFAKRASGAYIKLPTEPSPEEKALALLRGALEANLALAPIIAALDAIKHQRTDKHPSE